MMVVEKVFKLRLAEANKYDTEELEDLLMFSQLK